MTSVVYKYPLSLKGYDDIELPDDAKVLTFQMQEDTPTIWVLHQLPFSKTKYKTRHFLIAGTGHYISEDVADKIIYIGTVQHKGFVWHLFEYPVNSPV